MRRINQLKCLAIVIAMFTTFSSSFAQVETSENAHRKYFIGSSLFMLGNLFPNPPSFYQLNFGYRFTPKDAVILEAITWKYPAPLGIPFGPSFDQEEEFYPGDVQAFGIGIDYQRYLWKKFYSTVHATPFLQYFNDLETNSKTTGFQLFLQLRFGYHIEIYKNRFFLEPSLAFNYWPINTNIPDSFQKQENKWPNYFLFEPGMHFGVKF